MGCRVPVQGVYRGQDPLKGNIYSFIGICRAIQGVRRGSNSGNRVSGMFYCARKFIGNYAGSYIAVGGLVVWDVACTPEP